MTLEVVTTNGSVKFSPVDVLVSSSTGEETKELMRDSSIKAKGRAFAEAIRGKADKSLSLREALRDLVGFQGLLESGEAKGAVQAMEG